MKLSCVIVAMMLFCAPAQAVPLVDEGLTTLDPNSGLRWLDATESTGFSYNDVNAELAPDGKFFGYRYATPDEVATVFTNAGIANPCCTVFTEPSAIISFLNLFGITRETSDSWHIMAL